MKTITLVIPCFNEHESLPTLIKELEKADRNISFLVVDNGSEDNTKDYLKNIQNNLSKNISILFIDKNEGYGHGIFTALSNIKNSKFIGWIHGDLQFEFSKLNLVYKDLESYKFSDENIFYKGVRHGRSRLDFIFSYMMGKLASIILGKKMFEINAQPTIFSRELLEQLDNPPKDFGFDTYVYWKAINLDFLFIRKSFLFPPRKYGDSNWNFGLKSRFLFSYSLIKYFISLKIKKY